MRVKAIRGVCIGVDRHMKPGDIEDLEGALVVFLVSIGAVEKIPEAPVVAEPELKLDAGKSGKKEK